VLLVGPSPRICILFTADPTVNPLIRPVGSHSPRTICKYTGFSCFVKSPPQNIFPFFLSPVNFSEIYPLLAPRSGLAGKGSWPLPTRLWRGRKEGEQFLLRNLFAHLIDFDHSVEKVLLLSLKLIYSLVYGPQSMNTKYLD
jgi:hypothetical protein